MAEKGASLIIRDFKNDLTQILNQYNMPMIIKKQVLDEIRNEVSKVAEYQIAKEEQEYKEALEQEEKEKSTEEGGDEECQTAQED